MKIALVVPTFPQISETFIVSKALGLLDRGWDVHMVCGSSPAANWAAFGPEHRVHELASRVHLSPRSGLQRDGMAPALRSAMSLPTLPWSTLRRYTTDRSVTPFRRVRDLVIDSPLIRLAPDVVHFEFGSLAPLRMQIGRRLGAAVTVSFRGFDLNYAALDDPDFYCPVWRQADGIHVLGEDLWRRAIRRGAPPELGHTAIPPAIDTATVDPSPSRAGVLGTAEAPLRVLSIGRLHWKKGYDDALEAVALLRSGGVEVDYRIIGDGDLLGAVAFWRHQLDLDDCVHLLRSRPPDVVHDELGRTDVLLHAAISEGFCNAVLEAQAHGVPVACTDADGLAENVDDGVSGIVVPRRDPDALADSLARLAADGELRARMGTAGRERAERLFRLEDQLDAWERFYNDALTRRRRRQDGRHG